MNEEMLSAAMQSVIDHYHIDVRGSSGERAMRCPVHDDKHASASVNLDKGLWHCHACGNGGSAITIVMERENMNASQAADFVRSLTGEVVRPTRSVRTHKRTSKRWIPPRLRSAS